MLVVLLLFLFLIIVLKIVLHLDLNKNDLSNRKWWNKRCKNKKQKCRSKRLQYYDWWKFFFDQPVKNDRITNDNIQKVMTGQGDDYLTDCLLDYPHFNDYYKIIVIALNKQQALDTHPKAMQQINLTGNLDWAGNKTILLIIEETKETILNFSQGTAIIMWIYFALI